MQAVKSAEADLTRALAEIVGSENVLTAPHDLAFYSTDIYHSRETAECVVRPEAVEQVARAVKACTARGRAVIARGAGLSYTGGYLPTRAQTVIFDLQRLDAIVEINETDSFVTVECGCSWRKLYEALKAKGLRTPYFGTASGYSSTIGGALSQNSSHFASAQFGISADTALGLEIVQADGTVLKTGSGAALYAPSPFFRTYGPDLTGLFLGDCGALGIKVRATLKLIPFPPEQRYAAFAFDQLNPLLATMAEIARRGLAAEIGGWDPPMLANFLARNTDLQQDMKFLAGVVRSGSSVFAGLRDAARIALTGRRAFKEVSYLLNVTIDESSAAAADEKLAAVRKIGAANGGRSVEPTFPRAHRGTPFTYPNGILGPKGQRWVPTHGLAPHSRAPAVAAALHAYLEGKAALMERHGIEWVLIMSAIGNNGTLIEPMFYWPDRRNAFHERWIQKDVLQTMPEFPDSPQVAAAMREIRGGLTEMFMQHGCAHFQIGKVYRYRESREPATFALLQSLKHSLDPQNLMNPGALGLP